MSAGKLHDRVAFDAPTGGKDAFGGDDESWSEVCEVAAQWIYAKGDEAVQAARQAGRSGYKIKVRSSVATRGLTTDHRMRDVRRGTTWNITEVDAVANKAWVYLVAEGPVV
jgi:head-tail adaptor